MFPSEIKVHTPRLSRSLSMAEVVLYGLGVIFGAGIYALVGEAAGITGNLIWLSFMLAAIVASFTALSYCELSSIFPKCAAEYNYVRHTFKSNLLGFVMGWLSLFAAMVGIAAVSLGFAGYFSALFGAPVKLTAIALIALLSVVNFLGVKESARLNALLTAVSVIGLLAIIAIGIPFFGSVDYFEPVAAAQPVSEMLNGIVVAAALIFFAFIGFEDMANISEETVNARHAIPKAILIALLIASVIYMLVSISVVSIVPWQELAASSAPISLVAGTVLGPAAETIFSFIALFATSSTVLILLIAVSRLLYGMSKGHTLPSAISRVHSRTKTPFVAIAISSVLAMLFVLAGELKHVAFITNFTVFAMFFMVNLSVIVLRFAKPKQARPFRIPGSIGGIPLLSLFGAIFCIFMISRVDLDAAIFGTIAVLLAIPAYFVVERLK
jgi:APA family basic amino acid/polyamine antiporter